MRRVKSSEGRSVPIALPGAPSAWPDVDRVEAPKLVREIVLATDQKEFIRVGELGSEAILTGQDAPPQRNAADRDRTPLPQGRQLLVGTPIVLPNARISPEQVLRVLPGPKRVDAAFVVSDRRCLAVGRALRSESRPSGPAHVMPSEGLESVRVVVAAHMPEPPPDDRLEEAHAGTGSRIGSSAGAGTGTGSSSGAISISCSVSGAPMSIAVSCGPPKSSDCFLAVSVNRQFESKATEPGGWLNCRNLRLRPDDRAESERFSREPRGKSADQRMSRRIQLIAAACLVAAFAVACGGTTSSRSGGIGESGAALVGSGALAYVAIDSDLGSGQWQQVDELLKKFPVRDRFLSE